MIDRRLLPVVLLLLLSSAASAQEMGDRRVVMDETARALVDAHHESRLAEEARFLGHRSDLWTGRDGVVMAGIVVRVHDPGDLASLRRAGMHVETVAGDVVTGALPAHRLGELAALLDVASIEVAPMLELLNDLGGQAIGVPDLHAGTMLPHPYRGRGVVVGVLDTGIDFSHPDFSDADGSRIEYLLDYLPDDENDPPTAQAEWTAEQITSGPQLVTHRDINGHGTHVAGTAAGGGMADARFTGVAPESRLIVVKGSRTGDDPTRPHSFSGRDIINGVAYIFHRAAEMQMPAVVNLSIGGISGPRDGTDNTTSALSNLAGEGRIVVFANGNDGHNRIHAGSHLEPTRQATMAFTYSTLGTAFRHAELGPMISVTGWYEPEAVSTITVSARDPVTHHVVAQRSLAAGTNDSAHLPLFASGSTPVGHARIQAATRTHPFNGHGTFNVSVSNLVDEAIDLRDHLWSITLTGGSKPGRVDAWVDARTMGWFAATAPGIPNFVPGDMAQTLNYLAAGHEILSAGAFVVRNQWLNPAGETRTVTFNGEPLPLGRRTYFSSEGPTRDGRMRPDVVAPGSMIASALTSHGEAGQYFLGAPAYTLNQGTSMAAPFLTGTVALMLQANPSLTPAEIRSILHDTATAEAAMGSLPNGRYGYGKLDAFAAVRGAIVLAGERIAREHGAELDPPFPNPWRGGTTVIFRLPETGRATLTLYDLLGREVGRLIDDHFEAGPHWHRIERQGLAAGVYLVVLRSGSERSARRVVIVD
jgi:minor extracellular serine protease Vpr